LRKSTFAALIELIEITSALTAVFDTSSLNFSVVPNEPFNGFRGPGQEVIDFSVARLFKLNERINLKFVAEAFDLFNHPNFQQNNINNVQYTTTQATDSLEMACLSGRPLPIRLSAHQELWRHASAPAASNSPGALVSSSTERARCRATCTSKSCRL